MANILASPIKGLKKIKLALDSLAVFRGLLKDEVLKNLYAALDYLCKAERDNFDTSRFINLYNDLFYSLISNKAHSLAEHIIDLILYSETPYSLAIEKGEEEMISRIEKAAASDLDSLELVANLSSREIKDEAMKFCKTGQEGSIIDALPEWSPPQSSNTTNHHSRESATMKGEFASKRGWGDLIALLADFYRRNGSGIFARYKAFIWERSGDTGYLKGIANPDPITLADLIG
ncbi:MAG: hypothetical protein ACPLTR_05320 [Thermacetogeniaceae bacterium]